jgi:hypothetical protein
VMKSVRLAYMSGSLIKYVNVIKSHDILMIYYRSGSKIVLWRCKYCTSEYPIRGGTAHIGRHLNKEHLVFESERPAIIARQLSIQTAIQHAQSLNRSAVELT